MSDQLFDVKNSFLYECDEVPFDEIPPEPGREIQKQSYGEIRIRVNKDATDDHADDNSNYYSRQSSPTFRMDGTLKRTINSLNEHERSIRRSSYYSDHDEARPHSSYDYEIEGRHRYDYETEARYRNSPSGFDYERRPSSNEHNVRDNYDVQHFRTSPRKTENNYIYNDHKVDRQLSLPHRNDRDADRNRYQNKCFDDRHERQSPNNPHNNQSGSQPSNSNYDTRAERLPLQVAYNNTRSSSGRNTNFPISQPIQRKRLLSDRLGPPVKRENVQIKPLIISTTKQTSLKSRSTTNFIEKNIAASKISRSKRLGPRPVIKHNALQQSRSIKRQTEIKKIKINNPISKAKQKTVPQKTNLSKNIALNLKKSVTNSNLSTDLDPTSGNDNNAGIVIANLIQGILEEPDVKEMITTIAQQSVSTTKSSSSNESAKYNASSSIPSDKYSQNNKKTLQEVADRILNKANTVLNDNYAQIDASQFQTNRPIPSVKTKQVKVALYCKSCKLEFPTTMLRDLHYKTEMHCFVNGDWWKFNPKPPTRIPRNKYPLSVFCIPCWDMVRIQSEDAFNLHKSAKRHKANRQKFAEVFGHLPLHHWCMWEDLSINFRNNFVPIPSQLRNVMHPEYVYDQRVIRK